MKIVNMIENGEVLYDVYRRYSEKIFYKIEDPFLRVLVLLSTKTNDLNNLLRYLKKYYDEFSSKMKKGNFSEAFVLYLIIRRVYNEYESKIIERIVNLVKLYAYYLSIKRLQIENSLKK